MREWVAVVAAAGWHGIGALTPDARAVALALVALLVALGLVMARRSSGRARGGWPDSGP